MLKMNLMLQSRRIMNVLIQICKRDWNMSHTRRFADNNLHHTEIFGLIVKWECVNLNSRMKEMIRVDSFSLNKIKNPMIRTLLIEEKII